MVKYFIAIPTGHQMPTYTAVSLSKLTAALRDKGIEYETSFEIGNCHVDDARNLLVSRFDRSTATDLVFIDSDIVFEPEDFFQLVSYPQEVVGATYPYKNDSGDFPCSFHAGTSYTDDETGLVPVAGLPTGFLKISRTAFDRLKPHMPTYKLVNEPGIDIVQFFDRSIRSGFEKVKHGLRVGGDISFCYDMTQLAGETCWLAPKITLGHNGSKTWTGNIYWKQSCLLKGVYPSFREAFMDDMWDNDICLNAVTKQWGNERFAGDLNYLKTCTYLVQTYNKKPILEMGSGLSTLFLALSAEKHGTTLTSLDQDRGWMGKTWGILDDAKVLDHAKVIHAEADGGRYLVDKEVLDESYGLCCVDGPRMDTTMHGRDFALEVDADCYVFDDAGRQSVINTIRKLEERGYNSNILGDIANRPVVVCARKET
jgi:predicted O-methyltransferase YrrM